MIDEKQNKEKEAIFYRLEQFLPLVDLVVNLGEPKFTQSIYKVFYKVIYKVFY